MKILLKSVILSLSFLLASCINLLQDVILYPDGSGEMHIDYWMILPDDDSRRVADKIGIFNPDSIRSEFSSKYTKISDIKVFSDSTDSSTHATVDFAFVRIDSLNLTRAFSDAEFLFKEGTSGQINFSQFIPPIATGFGINASNYNVTYRYTFSGSILFHNAHRVENKTLIWSYSLDEIGGGKTISVIFRPYKLKKTPDWIYMLTGAVLVLVIFFLFKRKKD
jgi:hypothetical protein